MYCLTWGLDVSKAPLSRGCLPIFMVILVLNLKGYLSNRVQCVLVVLFCDSPFYGVSTQAPRA